MCPSPNPPGGRDAAAVALVRAIERDARVVERVLGKIERRFVAKVGVTPAEIGAARAALERLERFGR